MPVTTQPVTDNPPVVTDDPVTTEKTDINTPSTDLSVLQKSVFIGDSRTDGLRLYTPLLSSGARVYCHTGLAVNTVLKDAFISSGGNNITLREALSSNKDFDSIYISLGINELGWVYPATYIDYYRKLIDAIQEINPSATIYVQSIIPVTKATSDSSNVYNNERIAIYNGLLKEMAADYNIVYLDVASSLGRDNGALPEDATGDGIHLYKTYSNMWLDYILNNRK